MADFQMMMWWPRDYIADTRHLTPEQKGAYTDLLSYAWLHGAELADDDEQLARMCGFTLRRWLGRIRPAMERLFTISDGVWYQKRQRKEFAFAHQRVTKNRLNAAQGGKAKALNAKKRRLANAKNSLEPNAAYARARPEPEPDSITTRKDSESHTNTESLPSRRKPIRGGSARARARAPNGTRPPDDAGASQKTNGSAEELRRGWKPDAETVAQAIAMLGTKTAVQTELKSFHYHHRERPKPQRSRDWNATFLKWCVGEAKRNGSKNPSHTRKS